MNRPLVIYHGSCDDGHGAAYVLWLLFKGEADYWAAYYGDPVPDTTGRAVYIVDFSYDKDNINKILDTCESLVWLDHHKTSVDLMYDIKALNNPKATIVADNKRSGARMAFDYVMDNLIQNYPDKKDHLAAREVFINYIQDNDLWTFELPESKEFSLALRSEKMTFDIWDTLDANALMESGRAMKKFFDNKIAEVCKLAYEKDIFGHKVKVANCNGMFASDVGHELAKDAPFSLTWWYDGRRKKFVFSMRSSDTGLDVGELAKNVGGGGHARAAGFQLDPSAVDEILDIE